MAKGIRCQVVLRRRRNERWTPFIRLTRSGFSTFNANSTRGVGPPLMMRGGTCGIGSPNKEGLPNPLGAHWDGKGTNFALFSSNAIEVEVCLFDESGERELSLRYRSEHTHIDGFRFDPGTILARESAVLEDIRVGGFPPGWAEWNDKFRDVVRGFLARRGNRRRISTAHFCIGRSIQSRRPPMATRCRTRTGKTLR